MVPSVRVPPVYRQATQRGLYVVDLDDGAVGHTDSAVVSLTGHPSPHRRGCGPKDLNLSWSINHSLGLAIN